MTDLSRRDALSLLAAASAMGFGPALARAQSADDSVLDLADPAPFSFEALKETARELAEAPLESLDSPHGEILDQIGYDAFNRIAFRREASLWAKRQDAAPVQFFHLGRFFQEPAEIHVVENGQAREIIYSRDYFEMPDDHPARDLPEDAGYSGFRIMNQEQDRDWLAFLGAAYFRSSGELDQYGLSARGVAVNTAMAEPEEFPRFTAFYLEPVAGERDRLVIYALLEGESVTGAYRMDCERDGAVLMDIDCVIYPRRPVARLGIAPLTSMFWYGGIDRTRAVDWRPQIHDSEGLALWTGTGERIWRPLYNPPRVMTNSFFDENPRGFGLMQRDRDFDRYQDDGVFYDRRPSLWVEPKGEWGRGHVQLVEIPTDDEIYDNIVAYWVPEEEAAPGAAMEFGYRLHWVAEHPYASDRAWVVDTFSGIGGVPGQERPEGVTRFVVDFTGGTLGDYERGDLQADVTLSQGSLHDEPVAYPVVGQPGRWRSYFDMEAEAGEDPVDMRLYLRNEAGEAITETWVYQYFPEAPGDLDEADAG